MNETLIDDIGDGPSVEGQAAYPTTAASKLNDDPVLARRLELAAGGIPIGITNRVGSGKDKHAHFKAMPGGPSAKYPDRPKGPGPDGRGAQYYATTDPKIIIEWSRQYPDCNTFIGGFLPDDVACIDIDRADVFRTMNPGMIEKLQERGHPTDKRIGKDRWHIWVRMPKGRKAKELGGRHSWGEVKWSGGLVVSSPSATYESVIPLLSWEEVPRLTEDDVLVIATDHTAAASLVSRRTGGGRHPDYVAISASMATRGCSRQQIIDEIWAVDRASLNPAYNDPSRQGSFEAEVERMVDGAIVKLGRSHPSATGGRPALRPKPRLEAGSLPEHLLAIDGLAGEIAEHIRSQGMVASPEMAFWGGIVAVAHACGRIVLTTTGLSPGIGVVLLAPSASGKEKPQEVIGEIFARAGLGSTIVRKLASGQGIEDRLEKDPKILLMVDEAMHLFRTMADPRQGPFSAEPILKELLSGKVHYTGRTAAKVQGRTMKPVSVFRPHLTFYGSAVPSEFFDAINTQMINGGLMGRLLLPIIKPGPLVVPAPAWCSVPDSIISQVQEWVSVASLAGELTANSNLPRAVSFTPGAEACWNDHRRRCHELGLKADSELEATQWARSAEKAARLSLVRAASRGGRSVFAIDEVDMEWACAVVDFYSTQMIVRASSSIATNETERRRNRFLNVMRKYLELHPNEVLVPHSYVLNQSKLSGRECQDTANDLVDCLDIQIHQAEPSSNGKRAAFYGFATPDSQVHAPVLCAAVNRDSSPIGGSEVLERVSDMDPSIDSPIHNENKLDQVACALSTPEVNQ